ncbi:hypothetical protein BGY98DRAFT_935590 [Russula aff. rugulosa BPL654]|nr:hypothetical protein BGY98DRAFT_935590 [Russula aff. rugulosa BPL654]
MASLSSSNFQSIFDAALQSYNNKTKNNLLDHPLATQLQLCDSPNAVLSVLQDLIQKFDQRRNSDERLKNWLNPIVNVLYTFSDTLGGGVGLVSSQLLSLYNLYSDRYLLDIPSRKVIFAGIGVLLLAAKDVNASQDMLVDLFERIESFFKRLECHTRLKPSEAMTDMMVKIMVEVLSVLAIVTVEIKERRRSQEFLKKLLGRNDVEDALKRLDQLTQEEAKMATAEVLKVTRGMDSNVKVIDNNMKVLIDVIQVLMLYHQMVRRQEASSTGETSVMIIGKQIRQDLRRWLSPPDSSINHNIARKAHYKGTTSWFFQGGIFNEWRSSSSLLWIHGKRMLPAPLVAT